MNGLMVCDQFTIRTNNNAWTFTIYISNKYIALRDMIISCGSDYCCYLVNLNKLYFTLIVMIANYSINVVKILLEPVLQDNQRKSDYKDWRTRLCSMTNQERSARKSINPLFRWSYYLVHLQRLICHLQEWPNIL